MTVSEVYLTVRQTAAFVGVSIHCLEDWRHRGRGPKYEKLGWNVFYLKAGLKEWTEAYWNNPRGRARSISKRPAARKS